MKEKFTKGPWRSDKWDIIGSDNAIVAKVLPWDSSGCRDEDGANVALITAAPEMYDALKEALMLVEMSTSYRSYDIADRCKAALEKARGIK